VDIEVEITDGTYHEVDSNTDTFRSCAFYGVKNAMKKANPVLLEPIMLVTINVPDEYVGSVNGYLSSKRGLIKNLLQRGKTKEIVAEAPLSEMFGYIADLRNLTSGTAAGNMEPSHYAEVPKNIMEKVLGTAPAK
ncbi:MAG: elongation factor G, partial [Candidatus Dojkabacteria bacterium]